MTVRHLMSEARHSRAGGQLVRYFRVMDDEAGRSLRRGQRTSVDVDPAAPGPVIVFDEWLDGEGPWWNLPPLDIQPDLPPAARLVPLDHVWNLFAIASRSRTPLQLDGDAAMDAPSSLGPWQGTDAYIERVVEILRRLPAAAPAMFHETLIAMAAVIQGEERKVAGLSERMGLGYGVATILRGPVEWRHARDELPAIGEDEAFNALRLVDAVRSLAAGTTSKHPPLARPDAPSSGSETHDRVYLEVDDLQAFTGGMPDDRDIGPLDARTDWCFLDDKKIASARLLGQSHGRLRHLVLLLRDRSEYAALQQVDRWLERTTVLQDLEHLRVMSVQLHPQYNFGGAADVGHYDEFTSMSVSSF